MNEQQASALIQALEHVAARPGMYFGKADVLLADVFLMGFTMALKLSVGLKPDLHEDVVLERGWRIPRASQRGIEQQMLDAGMSPAQAIAELVAIEIEIIKRSTE